MLASRDGELRNPLPKTPDATHRQLIDDYRKTGITLNDTGRRDEYGMEPISGIFSSPEKSPPKRSARKTGGSMTDSESMELQEST